MSLFAGAAETESLISRHVKMMSCSCTAAQLPRCLPSMAFDLFEPTSSQRAPTIVWNLGEQMEEAHNLLL